MTIGVDIDTESNIGTDAGSDTESDDGSDDGTKTWSISDIDLGLLVVYIIVLILCVCFVPPLISRWIARKAFNNTYDTIDEGPGYWAWWRSTWCWHWCCPCMALCNCCGLAEGFGPWNTPLRFNGPGKSVGTSTSVGISTDVTSTGFESGT